MIHSSSIQKINADGTTNGLYRIPLGGGSASKLTDLPETGWLIDHFQLSHDSATVIFKAWQWPGVRKAFLYIASLTGGGSLQIADNTTADSPAYFISPNNRIVYSRMAGYGISELYSRSLKNGSTQMLSPGLQAYDGFQLSSNGGTVVYSASKSNDSSHNLYSVSIDGGVPIQLNMTRTFAGIYMNFQISPDSRSIVYAADISIKDHTELYTVPLGGGLSRKLNLPIPTDQQLFSYWLSSDSRLVVYSIYRYDPQQEPGVLTALISASLDGSRYVSLQDTLATGNISDFLFSPNSSQVVYRADQNKDNKPEMYSVSTYPLFISGMSVKRQSAVYLPVTK